MKKFISILLVLLSILILAGCGNMSVGIGNYNFQKVHIDSPHFSDCIEIKSWYETERGLEVKTEEYGNIFLSEGTYYMIEDNCPFCDKK